MKTVADTRRSLVDIAVDELGRCIAEGRWAVGQRIPTEPELAEQLGISRNTVREAVRVLLYAGLLEVRQGDGTYVRALTHPGDAMRAIARASLREHMEARCLLEEATARLAAQRRDDADLAAIEAALAARPLHHDELGLDEFVDRDLDFHRSIARACGNTALAELYLYFSQSVHQNVRLSLEDRALPEPDHAAHAAIVDAIRAGDAHAAANAAAAITRPILATLDQLLATPSTEPRS